MCRRCPRNWRSYLFRRSCNTAGRHGYVVLLPARSLNLRHKHEGQRCRQIANQWTGIIGMLETIAGGTMLKRHTSFVRFVIIIDNIFGRNF